MINYNRLFCVLAIIMLFQYCNTVPELNLKKLPTVEAQDSFTDLRDGTAYPVVKINDQVWLAGAIEYVVPGSLCPENDASKCLTFGRLYSSAEASKACPSGWRLPSDEEYKKLWISLDAPAGSSTFYAPYQYVFDTYFSVKEAGYYNNADKAFYNLNSNTYLLTTTLADELNATIYSLSFNPAGLFVQRIRGGLNNRFTCLCIKN